MKQGDLFHDHPEPALFSEEAAPAVVRADPEKVRAKLHRVIDEMRAAAALPWGARKMQYWRTVVPQMTLWLPEEEAAQLRLAFETEAQRLGA
jgi:hypothetical protein